MFYYRILLDVQRDYTFTGINQAYADITTRVKRLNWQFGMGSPYDFMGTAAYLELVLDNADGALLLEQTSAAYYGRLRRGTLVRVQMSTNGASWTNMVTLKIMNIMPTFVFSGSHEVTLKCADITADFLNQDFVAPLQTNVTIDAILEQAHIGNIAVWPYKSSYQFIDHTVIDDANRPIFDGTSLIDFEVGETTLAFYGDNLDRGQGTKLQQYIRDAVQAEIFGLYYFSPRDELFHFLSRYHASDTASSWNVTDSIMDAPQYSYGRDLVNKFSLTYSPRAIGTAESVLWDSDSLPLRINAYETKTITVRYRDPNVETASVGALAVLDPVRGTDWIATADEDGLIGQTSATNQVDITVIKGASSSQLVISNRVNIPRYLQTLQLRGTPITTYNREQANAYNDDSDFGVGADASEGNDTATGFENLPALSDADFAQAYANYKVSTFGQPQQVIERLVIPVKQDDLDTQSKILSKTIGDVMTVTDSYTGHNRDYMIVGESHSVMPSKELHTVTYVLRPTNRGSLFILDESSYDGGASFSF